MKLVNPVSDATKELREVILAALGRAVANNELSNEPIPAFNIEIPADKNNGDFATNVAMVSARAFKLPPRKIAEIIANAMVLEGTSFERVEVAGPGFINVFLSRSWFSNVVSSIDENKDDYGKTSYGENKKVLVEFVSANPTGPMHIGNARGGAIGDGLASVLDWAGYDVKREFYVNDAGNQINKFAISLETRYLQLYLNDIEMPEDAYQGEDIINHAKAFAAIHGDKFVDVSSEERKDALVAYALPLNIKGLHDDLLKYRIEYDNWFLESTLHKNDEVSKVVALLKEKGHTYESEGATWFKATEFGADKDFVLVRSNGVPTYVVPDIAYHYNKLVTRGFDKAIDVLGADHHGYVPRLKAALQALDIDPSRLDVVLMQMVRLVRGSEIIKASKRSGKAITLVTLLDEVPIDAARFHFNLREANSHFDFDLDLAVEQSSQNPVYYVQYAHARICSILLNLGAEGITPKAAKECNLDLLNAAEEVELIRHLSIFPNEIIEASKSYDPPRITRYAIDLATLFHKFYNACRVKSDDKELMYARLALCMAVKTTIKNVLTLLKIDAPTSM
ncbi:arginine--tRNA ligase [Paludicola sp. MB14-C6]|uniref:arginine--tRNA ligase n=1 Tax=Paludihabitans sp. MB14-C6 TaxID=3070656 RepID=UPI0027DB0F3C|nr:arginine--tRNA ligase [Paludicola sp. MB14-C6]WMJ22062.1 arginine--tRNA ligase [Paludicola sp. MB14-C6]